jgi:hypothetical protein
MTEREAVAEGTAPEKNRPLHEKLGLSPALSGPSVSKPEDCCPGLSWKPAEACVVEPN